MSLPTDEIRVRDLISYLTNNFDSDIRIDLLDDIILEDCFKKNKKGSITFVAPHDHSFLRKIRDELDSLECRVTKAYQELVEEYDNIPFTGIDQIVSDSVGDILSLLPDEIVRPDSLL